MTRILVAECMQEISSFNPRPSGYGDFRIQRGNEMLQQRGMNTPLGGALSVFEATPGIELALIYGARASSAGILGAEGWTRLSGECLSAIEGKLDGIDAVYFSMHGAMGAQNDLDPEGHLLTELRRMVGPNIPIVISLDLHAILTERMIANIDGLTMFHTYPHVDLADTGERAARLLLDVIERQLKPVIVRVPIPALTRGDENITKTGCYGDLIRKAQLMERNGTALAAGILIGNPFTDVPELGSQVVATVLPEKIDDASHAVVDISERFWAQRHLMQAKLIPVDEAVEEAGYLKGPVAFTDAADATSSGASGDSNLILAGLIKSGYRGKVLAPIVDAPAAAAAHKAGIGATIEVTLGGTIDPVRFPPLAVKAVVKTLTDGSARLETMRLPIDGGPTAVLAFDNFTVMVLSKSARLFDRSLFFASGLQPKDFDLVVIKSPHCEYEMFDAWVEKNFNVDVEGATSANLPTLGHTICRRPMYPLEPDTAFQPAVEVHRRG
ncbi:MAG TPA: M81 family metallopeptidase [Devosia sp.]|nr:M81 family metallopeptidase [Devosia sp.]